MKEKVLQKVKQKSQLSQFFVLKRQRLNFPHLNFDNKGFILIHPDPLNRGFLTDGPRRGSWDPHGSQM